MAALRRKTRSSKDTTSSSKASNNKEEAENEPPSAAPPQPPKQPTPQKTPHHLLNIIRPAEIGAPSDATPPEKLNNNPNADEVVSPLGSPPPNPLRLPSDDEDEGEDLPEGPKSSFSLKRRGEAGWYDENGTPLSMIKTPRMLLRQAAAAKRNAGVVLRRARRRCRQRKQLDATPAQQRRVLTPYRAADSPSHRLRARPTDVVWTRTAHEATAHPHARIDGAVSAAAYARRARAARAARIVVAAVMVRWWPDAFHH